MKKLGGKVAIVTGASRGIGAEIAKTLAGEGVAVVAHYFSRKEAADQVVRDITAAGGQACAMRADISRKVEAAALVAAAIDRFGHLDIVVNNGGIVAYASIEESSEELYRRLFDANVLGIFLLTQAALKYLERGASIINISSGSTKMTPPQSSLYSATKGAVDIFSRVLARELGPRGIRVNTVNPGLVETEGTRSGGFLEGASRSWAEQAAALGRIGQVDDIAPVVAFLASDDARWLTGEVLYATGGMG
ncbi:glucose 1-dehydrogenase [Pseudonocardia spinosispora]|uniref:glucose 1-dehydrogenase n=1 Tax=Pseudonocardia spinosispora TaxID=103441 RepID=UPI0004910527|nr:glucose 1-dehydrogenase [Pseudonocardia spinosispora]